MTFFEINLLGSPEIKKNGKSISLSRHKSVALIAYLADTQRRVFRNDLASLFWPDSSYSHGLAALRTVLAEIKSTTGPNLLVIDKDIVHLAITNIKCDVLAFRNNLNHSNDITKMKKTADYWRGGFLKGFELHQCQQFSDWQFLEEQNLLMEYKKLLKHISSELIEKISFDEAISYSRKSLILDQFDENTHREIMKLYIALGNTAAALRQYEVCKELLDTELGFPPEEQTKVLAENIRTIGKTRSSRYTLSELTLKKIRLPRIVVLPFVIRNSLKKEHFILNNIFGEILADKFSSTAGLEVVSQTSALSYNNSSKNLPRIAAELRVDYIVEGFIEVLQDKMIVESRLIHASRDAVIYINRENIKEDIKSLLEAGTLMASNIVKKLGLTLKPTEKENYKDPGKTWKLHAKHLLRMWNQENIEQAMNLYNKAIKLNPIDAEAWAGLAFAYINQGGSGLFCQDMEFIFKQAEKAITKALSIDPNQPTALWIRGQISAERDWDYESAERFFIRALKYDPENSEIYTAYSQNLNTLGRPEEALSMAERACELDPVNSWNLSAKYWSLIGMKSYRKSDEVLDELDKFFHEPIYNKCGHGFTQILLGNFKNAINIIEPIKEDLIAQNMPPFAGMLAYAYAADGRAREAEALIEEQCKDKESLMGFHLSVAATYGVLGKVNLAMDWLEKAAEARDPGLFFIATTPFYKTLYEEPRFIMLVKRINIRPNK